METRTIAQLRALKTPSSTTKYCLPEHENYIAWQYDPLDKTTPDDGKTCIVTSTGKRIKKKMIINIVAANSGTGTPSTSTGSIVTPNPPSWIGTSPFNDTLNTATFIPSSGYAATEHEYRYRITGGSFGSWITATSNVISLPAADIATGDLELRVKSATGRNPSSVITNSVAFTAIPDMPPTVISATATSSSNIQIVFSETVTATIAGWSFKKNGSTFNPLSLSGSGSTWNFTVGTMAYGDTITRSYSSPSTGKTRDSALNELGNFTDQIVTNSIASVTTINVNAVYGVTTGTGVDNTTALMLMNTQHMGGSTHKVFDFTGCGTGEIRYSDPTWLFGFYSFKIYAPGISFRCTGSSPFGTEKTSFTSAGIFWQNRYAGTGGLNTGYKFNSVSSGASTITLNESGWSLTPGDRVYICGFEEQGYGEPVNPRFFEWKVVQSVVGSAITFTTPLAHTYDANWKDMNMPGMNPPNGDGTGLFGKPRLFKIPSVYTTYAEFAGAPGNRLTFAKGTNVASDVGAYFFYKAQTVICNHVNIDEHWPTESETVVVTNSTVNSGDLDKNVGTLTYDTITSGGLTAATGVDRLNILNSTINGYCSIAPRSMYLENNTFTASSQHNIYKHPEGTGIEEVYIADNTFTHTGAAIGNQPHIVYYTSTFTSYTGTNSSQIIIQDTGSYNPPDSNWSAIKAIVFGTTITGTSGKSAKVTNITHNGSNWVLHLTDVVGTPASGQTWTYDVDQKVIDLGGNTSTNGYSIF